MLACAFAIVLALLPRVAAAQAPPSGSAQRPAPAVAQLCVQCHGREGEGLRAGGFPRLAAQPQYYLAKQLADYASGRRRNAVMEPIAKALSVADRDLLAAYYAAIDVPAVAAAGKPSERGRALAGKGDDARRLPACENCHGPDGSGRPPLFPYLAGLDAGYLAATLNDWRRGLRRNDAGQQMTPIALALSDEDVVAVAAYFASLAPPKPVVVQIAAQARGDPARGRAIIATGAHGCQACHTIPGIRPRGIVGPPLAGLAQRSFIAGQLPNQPAVLVAFLRDPPALVPRTGMPNVGLTQEEATHIAAFLSTLDAR